MSDFVAIVFCMLAISVCYWMVCKHNLAAVCKPDYGDIAHPMQKLEDGVLYIKRENLGGDVGWEAIATLAEPYNPSPLAANPHIQVIKNLP